MIWIVWLTLRRHHHWLPFCWHHHWLSLSWHHNWLPLSRHHHWLSLHLHILIFWLKWHHSRLLHHHWHSRWRRRQVAWLSWRWYHHRHWLLWKRHDSWLKLTIILLNDRLLFFNMFNFCNFYHIAFFSDKRRFLFILI